MANRKIPFVQDEYFHLYSRGNSKQKIFLNEKDYDHFAKLLYLSNSLKKIKFRDDIVRADIDAYDFERGDTPVFIGAWVLMPNHFHIFITPNPHMSDMCKDGRNLISEFMRKLLTSYTKYFNAKYRRTGGLFEGNFKSTHLSKDIHAKYLFSYIHLNPIKLMQKDWKEVGIKDVSKSLDFLKSYKWGSYLDHKGVFRKENKILNKENFINYFPNTQSFDKEIFDLLNYTDEI